MKAFIPLLALLAIGCSHSGNPSSRQVQTPSVVLQPDAFEDAVETIATSTDSNAVGLADWTLRGGGLDAIETLRKHLNDARVPPSNYLTRSVTGKPDMSDHCFWLIQDMIEPPVPKLYASLYSVLSPANVTQWLDDRRGKSILQLQIDAASGSLDKAQIDFDSNGKEYAQQAVRIYKERLGEMSNNSTN